MRKHYIAIKKLSRAKCCDPTIEYVVFQSMEEADRFKEYYDNWDWEVEIVSAPMWNELD